MGVLFINNINYDGKTEITNYINNFITKLKEEENIDCIKVFKASAMQNIILALIIWFFGTTVIGLPVVFGLLLYRGFCLGYTISAITMSLGTVNGTIFICTGIFLQNIIFIPALIALGVSGFKLYKSIVKDRRKENIKPEVLRHTIFSTLMLIVLIIASFIETFLSNNILQNIAKYF
jgi:stage II sporulation protein M